MRLIGPPPLPPAISAPPAPPPVPHLGTGGGIWLARHAEVAPEYHGVAYGAMDVPLSQRGEEQTRALAAAFAGVRVRAIHSSDLSRALALGRALAEATGAPLIVSEALREIDRGEWTGLPRSEFDARWAGAAADFWRDPLRWNIPGGESEAALFGRAWPAVLAALEAAEGGTTVIAAHANLIRIVLARATGRGVRESYELETRPAHASLLLDAREGWRVAAFDHGADAAGLERLSPVARSARLG